MLGGAYSNIFERGNKLFELSNHLGNVLAVVADKKFGIDNVGSDGIIDYYTAEVRSAQDYYPFGMLMPGRRGYLQTGGSSAGSAGGGSGSGLPVDLGLSERNNNQPAEYKATNSIEFVDGFQSGSGDEFVAYITDQTLGGGGGSGIYSWVMNGNAGYRYGFNGKENDNDVKGQGDQQDYGMRIYDPRLGRFLSTDPLSAAYPWYTPYQFAGNRPILAIDLDGLEPHDVNTHKIKTELPATAAQNSSPNDPVAFGKNVEPWKDLQNFKIPEELIFAMQKRGIGGTPQYIEDAESSKTNFDYYAVKIDKLPDGIKDAGDLLERIRLNLGQFLDSKTTFAGYDADERKKWNSNDPLGSIMSFDAWFEFGNDVYNLDDASVMTSSYYKGTNGAFWTFSTLTTPGDGGHPIAGTRQFGVSVNIDKGATSYLFYIRATDRAYGAIEGLLQNTVFSSAEETWNTVCRKVAAYVNSNGGNASNPYLPISKRIPWSDVKK